MKTKLNYLFSSTIEKNLKKATNNDYHIVRVLGEGARTLAVLVADDENNLSVYKCDKKLSSLWNNINDRLNRWKKEEKHQAIDNLNKIANNLTASMETKNLFIQKLQDKVRTSSCQVGVPKSIHFNKFILEEYAGETAPYQLLSGPKADELAFRLAEFYVVLHHTRSPKLCETSMFEKNCSLIPQILSKYKYCIPMELLNKINSTYLRLSIADTSDEIYVPTHGDFKRANLCYDSAKDKLSLIDWELADINNIYSEFLCSPLCAQQIPLTFISNVVDNYNKLSPHKIDKNKLKDLYFLTTVNEVGKSALINKCSLNDFVDYYHEDLILRTKMIENEFIVSSDLSNEINT